MGCCNMPIFEFFSSICKNVRRWSYIFHEGSISVGCLPQKSEKHKDPVRRVEWTCKRRIVLHASMRTSLSHSQSHVYFKRNNICGQEKCIKHWLFWYHLSTAATLVCMYQCRWTIIPLISIKSCLYAATTFQNI